MTKGSDNILAMFYLSTVDEKYRGLRWYPDAKAIAHGMALRFNLWPNKVVGVIAALSPQVRWTTNVVAAEKLLQAYVAGGAAAAAQTKVAGFPTNKRKALRILLGEADDLAIHSTLRGQKQCSFFWSIVGCINDPCVDGHAYSVWLGERVPVSKTPKITPRLYAAIQADYIAAAAELGGEYTPAELQAITWLTYRRLHNLR